MLNPIFDLLAGLLEWFYSLVPSYGFAIIALTTLVLVTLSPLTYKSTKSMVSMRRLQPQVKRIQKRNKGNREKMNQEMMALYQEHGVSPLSGCLPILIQSPVFIVMFRVIRGITRRSSTIGFDAAKSAATTAEVFVRQTQLDIPSIAAAPRRFNPEYLSETSDMYQSLVTHTEMLWLGLDLSRTPLDAARESIGTGLPYLAMVGIVAFLGWYQQVQIQGRMTGEVSSQQQLIMKIMPWMLPIFAFTMPAGLVLYFIVSSLLRIIQQAYITRTVYGNEELTKPLEVDDDDDDDDDDDEDESPLAALFGGSGAKKQDAQPSARHGSRRPTSGTTVTRKRTRPPRGAGADSKTTTSKPADKKPTGKKPGSTPAKTTGETKTTGWGRAKRSAPPKDEPEKPVSRRITPKGDTAPNRRRKK
jgi:YidC/Oxa1 family membrane protein insertase